MQITSNSPVMPWEIVLPDRHGGGREPEFLGMKMPAGSDPLRWLATQVAQHERFGLGVLAPVLADLIGTDVLTVPSDMTAEDYRVRYLAFRLQQIEVQRLRSNLLLVTGASTGAILRRTGHAVRRAGSGARRAFEWPSSESQTADDVRVANRKLVAPGAAVAQHEPKRKLPPGSPATADQLVPGTPIIVAKLGRCEVAASYTSTTVEIRLKIGITLPESGGSSSPVAASIRAG